MRRGSVFALALTLFIVVGGSAHGQGLAADVIGAVVGGSQVGTEDSGESPIQLDISFEGDVDTGFFARETLGFDLGTLEAIGADGPRYLARVLRYAAELFEGRFGEVAEGLLPWLMFLLFVLAAFVMERRARHFFDALALRLVDGSDPSRRRVDAARRIVIRSAGVLAIPTAAWLVSHIGVEALFDGAPWTVALSRGLALFVVYRVFVTLQAALLLGEFFDLPPEPAVHVSRVALSSARAVLFFAVVSQTVEIIAYRADVRALSETFLRLSLTLLSVRALAATRQVSALLPDEGNASYLRVRTTFVRHLRTFLVFTIVLLALWTLGFQRAATTILARSWGIALLVIGGALALRWFEAYSARPRPGTLVHALVGQVDSFARFCINLAFFAAILELLGLLAPLRQALDALGVVIGSSEITALGVVRAVVVIAIAVLLSRVVRVLLDRVVYPAAGVNVGRAYALNVAIHAFLLSVAVGTALVTIGVDFRALTVFAGALGVGLGFGLQDVAKDVTASFGLLFGRTIKKGDFVTVADEHTGVIEEIRGRKVRVRTRDNLDLFLPAADLVSSPLINWTHGSKRVRLHVPVGVSYGADVHAVKEALLAAAERCALVESDPAPDVWFVEFGQSAINFELLVWIDAGAHDPHEVRGRVHFHIWDALAERDIQIPFPQRDLHVRSVDPAVVTALLQRRDDSSDGGNG